MKLLPCEKCQRPALATREGYLWCASKLSLPLFRYKCKRCGSLNSITSQEFASLPRMTDEEIKAKTCDITWEAVEAKEVEKKKES
jgi:hypothetical protein